MRQTIEKVFFALIRFEINGNELGEDVKNLITSEMLSNLFKLSKRYDLAHLIADALEKNNMLSEETEIQERFLQERGMAVYRVEQQRYELEQICATLESAKIPFVPLKGSILRKYYPESWMRTSCDIDILIHKKDLSRAIQNLQNTLFYKQEGKTEHDVSLYAESGVHLELHHCLIEEDEKIKIDDTMNAILMRAWDFVHPHLGTTYQGEFSADFFYFYHMAHMAKHFVLGGCGIRPFLDIHILGGVLSDAKKREALLEEGGVNLFTKGAENLSKVWFSEGDFDELSKNMSDYILNAGMYGDFDNRVMIQKNKKGGKRKYIFARIFLSKKELGERYPRVQKSPWTAPFYHVRRCLNVIFGKHDKKRLLHELKTISNKNENQEKVIMLMRDCGFLK